MFDFVERNLLKEVSVGRTAGPFCSPSFKKFQIYPIALSHKSIQANGVQFFIYHTQTNPIIVLTQTFLRRIIHFNTSELTSQLTCLSNLAKVHSFEMFQSTQTTGNVQVCIGTVFSILLKFCLSVFVARHISLTSYQMLLSGLCQTITALTTFCIYSTIFSYHSGSPSSKALHDLTL